MRLTDNAECGIREAESRPRPSTELAPWLSRGGGCGLRIRHSALRTKVFSLFFLASTAAQAATGTSVSWSIGTASSTVDGIADAGPITFTWTFDREVTYGTYLDGTPWVIWEDGLQLIDVSPAETTVTVDDYNGISGTGCRVDLTAINMGVDRLPLDERMGSKYSHAEVWDGTPATLSPGDCIATARGRRDAESNFKKMLFTAFGVCNIVNQDMSGRFRPPVRMPVHLRAALVTPRSIDVTTVPAFDIPAPLDWAGNPVTLDFTRITASWFTPDPDVMLHGPESACGMHGSTWNGYEPSRAMLNQSTGGTADMGYQGDQADRLATLLYTAFNPAQETARRQRCLDRFLQAGMDYFYQNCLGQRIWDGGGGHCDAIEGVITLTGAILGDSVMTNAIKYQRFPGRVVGRGDTLVDMASGSQGNFTRTEALYTVSAAEWKSGVLEQRAAGTGAASLDECYVRMDMARGDHCLNVENVPYTSLATADSFTAITIDTSFVWPMFSMNPTGSADQKRAPAYIINCVARLAGDERIRKITYIRRVPDTTWTESTWYAAGGRGGILYVYPALTADETASVGTAGTLTTGICSQFEARDDKIVMWESWPTDSEARILRAYTPTPFQDYLDNKLADNFHWLPYYHLFDDPGAPGKKLHEESAGYAQMTKFFRMIRDNGSYFWDKFGAMYRTPSTPTIQALVRHYVLDDSMSASYCKTYDPDDSMWNEAPAGITATDNANGAAGPACPGLMTRALFLQVYPNAQLFQLDGIPVTPASPATGIYLVKLGQDTAVQTIVLCN